MRRMLDFLNKSFLLDRRFIGFVWLTVVMAALIKQFGRGISNNFLIFRQVYYHVIEQKDLYAPYPAEYFDLNHYGPAFSVIIAPFALLPLPVGAVCWALAIAGTLFWAIYKLPLSWPARVVIFYLILNNLYSTTLSMQTNALIAALIIGSFLAIRKEKEGWAALFIALGFFIKLYGIVGLAFFFFSKHKLKFAGYFFLWSAFFFLLPMLLSSPEYILHAYQGWFISLMEKNTENACSMLQDISVMGLFRRISGCREMSNLPIVGTGLLLFGLQYLRIRSFHELRYQLGILTSVLLFVVLFSSGSEPNTYVIAMTGVGLWFVMQGRPYKKGIFVLFIFAILFTALGASDLYPRSIRVGFIRRYALQALPCLIVWLVLVYQLVFTDLKNSKTLANV